ncbi:MAG: hypothetical protein M1831_002146 [Alyxoria varia]|nr:MAG: hypothetical protein M1831_002146 [Alyxoria varia]
MVGTGPWYKLRDRNPRHELRTDASEPTWSFVDLVFPRRNMTTSSNKPHAKTPKRSLSNVSRVEQREDNEDASSVPANDFTDGVSSLNNYHGPPEVDPPYRHYLHSSNAHGGPKSLSGISFRSFALGASLALNTCLTLFLLLLTPEAQGFLDRTVHFSTGAGNANAARYFRSNCYTHLPEQGLYQRFTPYHQLWRFPFFLTVLSLFHYLEYIITALYNPSGANISAFLLTNGRAYNIAHSLSLSEITLTTVFFSTHQSTLSSPRRTIPLGLLLILLGQSVRTLAMAHAGPSFNHTVQTSKLKGHALVTGGVYSVFRHPAYFGFFWWAIGTQVVVGNLACGLGYAGVLWVFFSRRIRGEEDLLVQFFGEGYVRYRRRTVVGIPGL